MSELKCNVEACFERFKNIDEKLNAIHGDMQALSDKVSNGLSDRLNKVENDQGLLQAEHDRRERSATRFQTAFLSFMVALSTAATYIVVRHFSTPHQPPTIQKP